MRLAQRTHNLDRSVKERLEGGTRSKTVTPFCRICIAGCGIEVTVGDDNRIRRIAPDKQNPHTWRDFCAEARTAGELVEHPAASSTR